MSVKAGEAYRFEQEVHFDGHRYGFPKAGEVLITRGSDGLTWNGTAFASGLNWQATTVDVSAPADPFHYYDWTVPAGSPDGATFGLRMRLLSDPDTEMVASMVVRPDSGGGGAAPDGVLVLDNTGRVKSVGGWASP